MIRKRNKRIRLLYIFISIAFMCYAAVFIVKTSFIYNGQRYFCLFDDAMISMRYAKNLAAGHGLVMNIGERVEGITNPLWVLYMAVFHLFPVPASKMSLPIQISGALFLLLALLKTSRIAHMIGHDRSAVTTGAFVLTAGYLPLINWSLIGMEVSLLTLLTVICVQQTLTCLRDRTFSWPLYVLLGIGTLVRLDFAVVAFACTVYLALMTHEHRKKHLAAGIGSLCTFIVMQTLFRLIYYHEMLPLTYYLKMTGYPVLLRISRGAVVFWEFAWQMYLLPLVLPLAVFALKPRRETGLLLFVFFMQCLYSIYVGGDAWENWRGSNRYISIVMPLLFVLLSDALVRAVDALSGMVRPRSINTGTTAKKAILIVLTVSAFLLLNRNEPPLHYSNYIFREQTANHDLNTKMVKMADMIRGITTPDAHVAVVRAGALPYFSGRYIVDILGKTDPVIAKTDMRQAAGPGRFTHFYPGHLKYDYGHSIGEMKPDVITEFWGNIEEAWPYVEGNYVKLVPGSFYLYIRKNSPSVRWDILPPVD